MKIILILITCISFYSFSKTLEREFASQKGYKNLTLKELYNLSPTSNIVVLQRRYLPRTGRLDLSPSITLILNSEFLIYTGAGGHIGFYFLEKHGFELRGFYSVYTERSVVSHLRKLNFGTLAGGRTIASVNLIYKWIPIYGKMSWFNGKIIPFEMYLMAGGGSSYADICVINPQNNKCERRINEWKISTLVGAGQSYAVTRNTAVYWDISHQYYGGFIREPHHSDIVLQLGVSFFIPHLEVR